MDDLISRQAVLENAFAIYTHECGLVEVVGVATIKDLPSVKPQERTGHWINAQVGKLFPSNDFKCSECGNILDFNGVNCGRGDANYCPNCGAKMEVEE